MSIEVGLVDDSTPENRLRLIVQKITNGRPEWKQLEADTGVAADKWRDFHRAKTKASLEMIEGISTTWPEYAFWLATGIDDRLHGHTSPYPQEHDGRISIKLTERTTAKKLFLTKLARKKWSRQVGWKSDTEVDDTFDSRIGEYTDPRAKQYNQFLRDLMALTTLRDQEEETLKKFDFNRNVESD